MTKNSHKRYFEGLAFKLKLNCFKKKYKFQIQAPIDFIENSFAN